MNRKNTIPRPRCPLHPDDYCTRCQFGASGPADCPVAKFATADYDGRVAWAQSWIAAREARDARSSDHESL